MMTNKDDMLSFLTVHARSQLYNRRRFI